MPVFILVLIEDLSALTTSSFHLVDFLSFARLSLLLFAFFLCDEYVFNTDFFVPNENN